MDPANKTNMHFFKFYFIFKLYNIVLVLPNSEMNPPQVYMCSPSWTLLPPPSPFHPSGSSQCTSLKHPVSPVQVRCKYAFWTVHHEVENSSRRGDFFSCQDISEVQIGPCFLNYISAFQVQLEEKKNVIIGSLRSEGQDSDIQIWALAVSAFQFISEAEWGYY